MHRHLGRQLKRLGLSVDGPPSTDAWSAFLARVGQTYVEGDQHRELLERAIAISSRETRELHERLRVAAATDLARERDRLRAVFDSVGDGLCVLDEHGAPHMINPVGLRLLGDLVSETKLPNLLASIRIPEGNGRILSLEDLHTGNVLRSDDAELLRTDGESLPIAFALTPLFGNGGVAGAVLVFRDIRDLKHETEERLETARRLQLQQSALLELSTMTVPEAGGFAGAVREITRLAGRTLGVERTSVWVFAPDRATLNCTDVFELGEARHAVYPPLSRDRFPRYFEVLETEQILECGDVGNDPRLHDLRESCLLPTGVTSLLDAPVRAGGEAIGVLCFEHVGPPRSWRFEEQLFAATVSNYVALAWEAVRRQAVEADLREARDVAEAASEAKTSFLARMSHEIRTPMNGVLGMTELLRQTRLTERQTRLVESAYRSGRALLDIINDILDISRIESGRLQVETVAFDTRTMIADSVDVVAEPVSRKGLRLDVRVDPDVPAAILGDPVRLRQILVNLLANAAKFTDSGGIDLDVHLEGEAAGRMLVFQVRDTGIGIAPEALESVFAPFSQAHISTTRLYGGTGLGLSIVRELLALMGGSVAVTSEVGRGSTFRVQVPLRAAAQPVAVPRQSPAKTELPSCHGHILLAEDHPVNQILAVEMLGELGCTVEIAETGRAALDAVGRGGFDLVLMDCQMPVMDGLEATRRLREAGHRLPVVALTANAIDGDRENCLAAGMDDFLAKPYSTLELGQTLLRWLGADDAKAA